jgi:hypothetical protein
MDINITADDGTNTPATQALCLHHLMIVCQLRYLQLDL